MKSIYLIGSLRNDKVPRLGNQLREAGWDAFDHWYGAGPEADDKWQEYVRIKGHSYKEALYDHGARCIFEFDKHHLERCDLAVLVAPAGKSGHMEFGWFTRSGKPGFVLFDKEPERYDVMYQFATDVYFSTEEFLKGLENYR